MSSIDRLAAQITRLERNVRALSTTPQLAYSSIEDGGSVNANNADGTTMAQYGGAFDGSFGAMSLNGPTPPTPSVPIVAAAVGGLSVRWDGLFTDALFAPMDFSRVEVHTSAVSGFVPDLASTLQTTIESPRGGTVVVRLPVGLYYVKFVTRSLSGGAGPGSVQASGTPLSLASGVDLSDAVTAAEVYADARLVDAEAYTDTAITTQHTADDAAYAPMTVASATGSRPSASTAGAGATFYDTTLSKPIWSDGTVWKDATGTTV